MILAWLNCRYHQREARAGEVPLAQIDRRTWAGRTAEISVERYDLDLVLRDRATQLFCDPEEIVAGGPRVDEKAVRSEEHTSELTSLMRISYAVFCLKQKNMTKEHKHTTK